MIIPNVYYHGYVETTSNGNKKVYMLFSECLFAFMWLRLLFLIRTSYNYSVYRDPLSKKICQSYGFRSGIFYTIKCQLLISPEQTVMTVFAITIFSAAYLVRIFEMPYFRAGGNPVFDSYWQSIWFTVITFTTIGYGDISPGTWPGQLVTILLAFWAAILLALLVVTMSTFFDLKDNQEMALRHTLITRQAAKVICRGIQYF